ncbi:MAG: methyl-accepting chemotaxis protein [Gallionella sp.]|nr:methyl-accepting chemotaxis protein [Gallionella sp.]MDD4959162.1 methyl-accepting chemotaxis protein [Gallionella sp.]
MVNKFRTLSIKWKIFLLPALVFSLSLMLGFAYFAYQSYWLNVTTSLNGLMNFVDAKQQGVIRFIDQNEKLARQMANLVEHADANVVRGQFASVVATDVFKLEEHPFKEDINAGKRKIPTWTVYHAIDYVQGGVIRFSSDPKREGRVWNHDIDLKSGYSDPYYDEDAPIITFAAQVSSLPQEGGGEGGTVYVHADARMLTNIVNGEIGNLAGDMGAFYLAGVGKTFDYYLVNKDNLLITESRARPDQFLKGQGSEAPWRATIQQAGVICSSSGVYLTNAKCTTGCRETMGFYTGVNGKAMLGASMPFYDSRWTIVVEQESSEVLEPMWTMFAEQLGMLLLLSVISIWLYLHWQNRVIVYPLKYLQRAIEEVEHTQNFSQQIEVASGDEFGELAEAFNRMSHNLDDSYQRDAREKLAEARKVKLLREQLATISEHIEKVASGDLSRRLDIVGDEDLARLGENLNTMTESLAVVASSTTEGINSIYSALAELQHSIISQSSGASEQAAAVNETTAALDQIKGMAAQAMERVKMLGETAERSRRESELGGVAVEQAIAGMAGILHRMEGIAQTILALSEQIQQIGEITGVVTNLAQQSKMLALNASIEAAKAGEAGKGFAVVAAEVRELAEQSQQSTAQVQKILQDIRHATDRAVMATEEGSKGVDAGMLSVQRSGDVMRQLNEVVRETAVYSQQISAVVKQQFLGLEQVSNAMKDINNVTIQFVSSAQQSKESSAGISKVADRLRDSVSTYKL